jgi:hypothetical protein
MRWGLLAATILGILMAWGKNFAGFNAFLFEHLPMYNKFRAPSMAQVIPQLTVGIIAVLCLQKLLFESNSKELLKTEFKKILYAVGGLFALLILLYIGMDYNSPTDPLIVDGVKRMGADDDLTRVIMSGLKEDRKAMFGGQLLRAFGFAVLLLGTVYLYMKNRVKPLLAAIIITFISTLELTMVSYEYLNEDNYVSPDEYNATNFTASSIDQQILQDKDPNFRVFNLAGDTYNESRTSYFHKSIGGYHPAKLRTYQDVIEKYLSAQPEPGVLNMLNTKYVIVQVGG